MCNIIVTDKVIRMLQGIWEFISFFFKPLSVMVTKKTKTKKRPKQNLSNASLPVKEPVRIILVSNNNERKPTFHPRYIFFVSLISQEYQHQILPAQNCSIMTSSQAYTVQYTNLFINATFNALQLYWATRSHSFHSNSSKPCFL